MGAHLISDYEMYLYQSYLPNWSEVGLEWLNCDFDQDFGLGVLDEKWWVAEGIRAFKKTMADQVASADPHALHILPLSGGVDSRAILGGLLENVDSSQIIAATYGIPGAWDFEIAKLIARKFGIRHEIFNLAHDKWDVDQLIAAASCLKYPVSVHQSYVRQKINNYFGKNCVYWSGLMGDALAGSDLPEIPNTDRKEAARRFVSLYPTPNYQDESFQNKVVNQILADCPWDRLYNKKFSLDQQLDMGVRQKLLTRSIVIVEGFNFKTPFLTKIWTNFITSVPYKWLRGYYLYKKIIIESYEGLSKLPSRATAGMPLRASKKEILLGKAAARVIPYIVRRDPFCSNPRTNYINFTDSLRCKGSFQDSAYITLQDLKERAIFDDKDIDRWWSDHLRKKMDYTVLLLNLSSLELLLKVGLMQSVPGFARTHTLGEQFKRKCDFQE
jgi:asparagine synthetase B (glutamine-hydrolysing)